MYTGKVEFQRLCWIAFLVGLLSFAILILQYSITVVDLDPQRNNNSIQIGWENIISALGLLTELQMCRINQTNETIVCMKIMVCIFSSVRNKTYFKASMCNEEKKAKVRGIKKLTSQNQ
jgi:dipeptide/tripeptide permease